MPRDLDLSTLSISYLLGFEQSGSDLTMRFLALGDELTVVFSGLVYFGVSSSDLERGLHDPDVIEVSDEYRPLTTAEWQRHPYPDLAGKAAQQPFRVIDIYGNACMLIVCQQCGVASWQPEAQQA
ncbi:hypothetical protein IGB42_04143 [Andreprevotia sp. IGB-42]|uniref:hypothetical protein n=1 Tax=Andreprevotia sp. IGB-42 TaxID=2497473 RepID=UPI001357047F|nr:hypothetical protein [Andreprevotia sp. IGB-42]KAF0811377.1 hypothetical protein IGB42_04143 [Andreprevotia sp. IGB-42]